MNDSEGVEHGSSQISRRNVLISGSIAGGLVWAAPAVSGLGGHALAQGTDCGPPLTATPYGPGTHTIVIPAGVTRVRVAMWGGGG
ncbi:MAG TPA: hypothetical protein VMM13_12150, partial [Euzebya sp.]|nr:hypothetical protein [Euzebya sp.]